MGGVLPARAQALPAASSAPRELVVRRPNILYLSHSRFAVQYNSRYPILSHHLTTINGLKLGIEFKHRFCTGGAVYFLSTGVPARRWSMVRRLLVSSPASR